MPPFVYRSLKEYMRTSTMGSTRQELLKRLLATAAKRKTQFHVDATGARLATSPETFGMNMGKQIMKKQAGIGTALLQQLKALAARGSLGAKSLAPKNVMPKIDTALTAAAERAERFAGVPRQVPGKISVPSTPALPSAAEIQQQILERAERHAGVPPQRIMKKQANPLTQMMGPALKRLQMLAQQGASGLKTYGKRLTGDSTLEPLFRKADMMAELRDTVRSSVKPRVDLEPMQQKNKLIREMLDDIANRFYGLNAASPENPEYLKSLFESKMAPTVEKLRQHRSLFPGATQPSSNRRLGAELARARGSAAQAVKSVRTQHDMVTRRGGLEDSLMSQWINLGGKINRGAESNATHEFVHGIGTKPGLMDEIYRQQHLLNDAIGKERDAIRKTRTYTQGGAAAATLGGVGAAAYNNSKQSAEMPQPSSRGETKKVKMPEASQQDPDCDPEGVQMTEKDHDMKQAEFNLMLRAMANGTYRKKQAFMTGATIGALGGLATSKPNQRASGIGRGALIGGGTELGAVGGAGFGGLSGAALGAILGSLLSNKPEAAAAGLGLGGLAGATLGGVGGGYAGHIGTKALLDGQQHKDVEPKKRKKDDDDKKTKQAGMADEFNRAMNKLVRTPSDMNIYFNRLGLGGAAIGGAYGALSAPRGEMLKRTLLGAGLGGVTGLGAGAGASLGANLAQGPNPYRYQIDKMINQKGTANRVAAGALAGAGGGGLLTNVLARKAHKEVADDDQDDKKDDKDVKKSAAVVMDLLRKNNPALPKNKA